MKYLPALFPITLVGLITSILLYEYRFNVAGDSHPVTSQVEFLVYLAGAFALSIEACKSASNNDNSVIVDQLTSLLFGLAVLIVWVLGGNQIYNETTLQIIPNRYEGLFSYKPFIYSCIVVWLDVINGFLISRFNRSR